MPLVDRNEISSGTAFPPERERARYNQMNNYYDFSQRKYNRQANDEKANLRRLQPNIYRFLMSFWKDAVVADSPVFDYEGDNRIQAAIEKMVPSIVSATEEVVQDMIRYGVGVYLNDRPMTPLVVDPRYWFPVRDAADNTLGDIDIIAYTYRIALKGVADHVRVTYYENKAYEKVSFVLSGQSLGTQTKSEKGKTGINPVIPVRLGSSFYGVSDFEDAEEYVNELHRRESGVSVALDKQANPHLALPESAVTVNEKGQAVVDISGMVIPYPPGESVVPQYIIWDASFESQENAIRRAEDRILKFGSISPILVDTNKTFGQLSGTAIRRLARPTVQKIRNIRQSLTESIKDVIVSQFDLIGSLGNEIVSIDRDKISLTWPIELSGGITDESDELVALVESGAIDLATVIQLLNRVSRKQAEEMAAKGSQRDSDDKRSDT